MSKLHVTRRSLLRNASAGGLMAAATPGLIGAARAQSARKTFVFVSGAFCGGWIWRRVTDRLEQGGHRVFAQSLTGLADRSHLLSKDVNLDTHIADVVNLIKWESLEDVCLVAWSYGGFVGSGALETIGDRVSSAVWLDAYIPADGQRVADVALEVVRKGIQMTVDKGEVGVRGSARYPAAVVAERDRAFAESKVTPHPVGTYLQQIKLSGALQKVAKKTYIRLPKFPQPPFDKALADCKSDKSWATFELPDVGHMAMLDAPDRVSDLILQAA
ncbi:pimeloyl-ACP methyl ester carboxylesterase [Bradyrhizobium japonicum]|jgi:pimeloyl-ACP methyl ester carboxylesterase|uniref:alpha/beta fold hydrolase n=1 Tax=Bradyrhizobium TaxID=374 RepID=UPI0018729F53|nr:MULTISPECIES: alpha/beta fold hydrolase [Bradyrhizobium]MBR0884672.1 alpha/beta fold hydrolase [Bradyrhizobium liaoningense]MBR0947597.1 alpha/beta fold hydrolase [Bradyrhizobium liaoningense]MBR1002666.1 alpha/beta fold hydrolase [Bradyrhizobium liaoningense]MBR1033350.1 alpha/beta fold hydrolase [Bradyrhizobium liaoningense]MBR1071016.1 alpha/beta fold hydrolase [Bradyrhizobium liaoningense]